jgi:hypothetical protein
MVRFAGLNNCAILDVYVKFMLGFLTTQYIKMKTRYDRFDGSHDHQNQFYRAMAMTVIGAKRKLAFLHCLCD